MKMQQTKSYWRVVAVAGVVGAFVASACTVTTSTDDSAGGLAGDTTITGGSTSVAGSFAVAGTGGVVGVAGTAGAVTFQCDPDIDGGVQGTPASCAAPGLLGADCSTCTASNCCAEFAACYATNPGNQCGYGGPVAGGDSEISCIKGCISAATGDGGVLDDTTIESCASQCVTPSDSSGAACQQAIGVQTSDLVGCWTTNCATACLGG
jgi:hypothetical protein